MQSIKRIVPAVALLALSLGTAHAEALVRVVAVVNNEAITNVQLDKALAEAGGGSDDAARRKALDRLVEDALLRQRADELGLQVAEEEVDAAVLDVQRQNRIDRAQLEEALRQQGIALSDYRQSLRRQILRFKLVGREIQPRLEVAGSEVRRYYEEHGDEFRETASVALKRITFALPADKAGRDARRLRAEEARRRLQAGAAFDEVVASFAGDQAEGADIGTVRPEELTAVFADAIRPLAVGACTEPIEVGNVLHLLVLSARNPGQLRPLEEVRDAIRNRLAEQKKAGAAEAWIGELKRKAHLELRL